MTDAPNNQPAEPINPAEVAEKLRAVIDARGLRQSTVAKEISVSQAALSSFLRGTYNGDNGAMATKATAWLESLPQKDRHNSLLSRRLGFVETPTAEDILEALQYAQFAGDLVLIAGMPGRGKTMALEHYRRTRPSVWLATMATGAEGVVPMLQQLGRALGLGELTGGAGSMLNAIIQRIQHTAGCLMIDEAHVLRPKQLECVRYIYDTTGIGTALCGHSELDRRIASFPQLKSRIGMRVLITKSEPGDIDAVIEAAGIGAKSEAAGFLRGVGHHEAGLRSIVKTVRRATVEAAGEGVPVGIEHVKRAWANLNLGEAE